MQFDLDTDPDEPRKPVKPAPNYFSTRVRLRIFSMFAALVLVIVMMNEAKKPENWKWMGFQDSQPTSGKLAADSRSANAKRQIGVGQQAQESPPEQSFDPASSNSEESESDNSDEFSGDGGTSLATARNDQLFELINNEQSDTYPVVGEQFWKETFGPLKTEGQRDLFRLLRMVCTRANFEKENPERTKQLVTRLSKRRAQYHDRLEENLEFVPDSQKRKQLSEELAESRTYWETKILPAWMALLEDEDCTMAQLQANFQLREHLTDLAFAQVEDATALSRAEEASAWLLCWERAQSMTTTDAEPVMQIQLVGQPESYRGDPVEISGWIRSARKMVVARNELGMEHYYVLWVRPADTNAMPYCVYASNLPEGFPEVTAEFADMNERVKIPAVFYKIRSYTATNDEVVTCPMLVADSLEWRPVQDEVEVDAWTPPIWMIAGFLIVMPFVAAGIAWLAFASTETRRFVPGEKTQQKIGNRLGELQKDPSIMSDLERVKSLHGSAYDTAQADSES